MEFKRVKWSVAGVGVELKIVERSVMGVEGSFQEWSGVGVG